MSEDFEKDESIHEEPESIKDMLLTDKSEDSTEHNRETTRSHIAKIYVYAFFITIGISFIVGLINCFKPKEYTDLLITISGILSGPLGFIIGYYFKASQKDQL